MTLKIASRVAVLGLALSVSDAFTQAWPNKPVKVLIPYGAGGATDAVARSFSGEIDKLVAATAEAARLTGYQPQ